MTETGAKEMTDAPVQKTLDEMRSDMVRAIEEGDRVLVEKMNALGEYDVSAFPGGQFVQFAERAAYLRGLEDAAEKLLKRMAIESEPAYTALREVRDVIIACVNRGE